MVDTPERKDSYTEEINGIRTTSSAKKLDDGTIEFSVEETQRGSHFVKTELIFVAPNGMVEVNSTDRGSLGNTNNHPELEEAVRSAFAGFQNHDITQSDAREIHRIIEQGLQLVPLRPIIPPHDDALPAAPLPRPSKSRH